MTTQELVQAFMDHVEKSKVDLGIFNLYLNTGMIDADVAEESDLGAWMRMEGYETFSNELTTYTEICMYVRRIENYLEVFEEEG